MSKCFLSHSSSDKIIVEKIVEIIGKSKCVYDKYDFDAGMKTMDEIFSGLDQTDVFVLLISNTSLESEWIKTEFNEAVERLKYSSERIKQIFPIIIDSRINHNDKRIPNLLRENYNLRVITSAEVIAKKILNQLSQIDSEKLPAASYYYGRSLQLSKFSERYYSPELPEIKSIIISGFPGIGKKAFATQCLKSVDLIKEYYKPITVSLSKNSSIQDLILALHDIGGFGDFKFSEIASMNTEECSDILSEIINEIQDYKEFVIIEDENESIVKGGDIAYWLKNALGKSRNGLSLVIVCNSKIDYTKQVKYSDIYFTELFELSVSDSMGLFDIYSSKIGLSLERKDREWFKDIFNGYPPQIIECANLIKEHGLSYVKNNSYLVSDYNATVATNIIDKCCQFCNKHNMLSLLSVISKFSIISNELLKKIIKIDNEYQNSLNALKRYSVCYWIGSYNDYIKVNSVIQNYIERNHITMDKDIEILIDNELDSFNNSLSEDNVEQWDISQLQYFIKENIKSGNNKTDLFIYPTLYLQTITELYNEQKFPRLIELVKTYKSNQLFEHYDTNIMRHIERLYCQALIKSNKHNEADIEIQYFRENNWFTDYYCLKGISHKSKGEYSDAVTALNKSLDYYSKNFTAMRELSQVYMTLQDFNSATRVARKNYSRNKENIYVIQPYFECVLEAVALNEQQKNDLSEMYKTLKSINKIYETPLYYQLMAQYEAYYKKDFDKGIQYINEGSKKFKDNMYIRRVEFDLYRKNDDINGMTRALQKLEIAVTDLAYKGLYYSRKAILMSYQGKTENDIREYLEIDCNVPNASIESIIKKCKFR